MSSSHHGKEKPTSTTKKSILSHFSKPHLNNVALLDLGSISSKQLILEYDFDGSSGVGSTSTLDPHGNSSGLETRFENLTRDDLSDGPTSSHDHPREKNDLRPKFRDRNPIRQEGIMMVVAQFQCGGGACRVKPLLWLATPMTRGVVVVNQGEQGKGVTRSGSMLVIAMRDIST
eukprot:Gb_03530 [translate_table: standard]